MYIFLVIVSLFFIALFSGLEIACLSSNRVILERESFYSKNREQFFSTLLVAHTLFLVLYSVAFIELIYPVVSVFLENSLLILFITIFVSALIVLVTAEIISRILFRINPGFISKIFHLPGSVFYIILYPVVKIVIFISKIILYPFGIKSNKEKRVFAKQDLMSFSDEISRTSNSDEHEKDIEIFQNALDFSEVLVKECMLPFHQIRSIEVNSTLDELQLLFVESGFSRIIVYNDSKENVVGYVSSKDLFKNYSDLQSMLRPIDFVAESMPAQKLLADFIRRKQALAIVVDEFGDIIGLVSLEDIMEEIFGEIEDEHDSNNSSVEKKISNKEFVFSGSLEVAYLNKKFGLGFPECEDYQTLAGYIIFNYQSLPQRQTVMMIDHFKFTILKVSATRIELVKIEL